MPQRGKEPSESRRRWTAGQKAAVVRRYLQGTSLADLADETGATPGQISQWRKQALEGLVEVFDRSGTRQEAAWAKELAAKEGRIHELREVVAELSEEVLKLKKAGGASCGATRSRSR